MCNVRSASNRCHITKTDQWPMVLQEVWATFRQQSAESVPNFGYFARWLISFDYNWPVINFLWSADDLGIWWSIHHRSMVYHWATIDWQLADFTGTWSTLNLPTDGRASGDNQVTVARLVGWWPLIHRSSPDWTCLAPDMLWCATLITV